MSLKETLLKGIKEAGDNIAYISEHTSLSYHELLIEAESLTKLFQSNNINKLDSICLEVSKNKDFLIALVACTISELILTPIQFGLSESERNEIIKISEPEYLLTKENANWIISKVPGTTSEKIKMLCPEGGFIRPTSGTTNKSKGVLISSNSALQRVEAIVNALNLSESDRVLCLMAYPFHFIASLLSFLCTGIRIITPDTFNEEGLKACCKHNKPNIIYASPYHLALLSEMDLTEELQDTRMTISTGTKLPSQTRALFGERYEKPITEIFGIIEVGLALQNINSDIELVPIPPIQAKISAEGTLLFKGPGMLDAYLSPLRPASEILKDNWFDTGDLVENTKNGGLIILGRSSSVIHIGAHKVFPEEIEAKLMEIDGVLQSKVYAIKHELFGSEIQADVISNVTLSEKDILTSLRKSLGSLKTPKKINFVKSISQTLTGKIKRI